jgi:type I restriction enzyme S subunit
MAVNLDELPLPDELPVIPDSWRYESLGDLVEERGVSYGIVQPGSETTDGVPIVRVNNIRNGRIDTTDMLKVEAGIEAKFQRSRLRGGEVLLTLVGTLGEVAIVPDNLRGWNVARAVGVIPVRKDPGSLWVSICLRSAFIQHCIRTWATTTVQATFNLRDLAKLPIPIPPTGTREAIAAVLGALDDKTELNRRMNATLEAMARKLFQSWFVDFDPVRAKLDGRQPQGLDAETAVLLPAHFQDSPLGYKPDGWKVTTLGACIGFRSGFSFKSQDWQETGVPVVKIGSVKPGIIDLTQVSYVSEDIAQQAARYRLCAGDILIGMTGYVGEVGLVPPSDNLPLLNQRVGKFVLPKLGTESLAFWYCATRQPEFRAFVEARSHGTAQANVSGEAIMDFPLVVPPVTILDAFNRACRPLLDRILANHAESRTLATLHAILLPKLLSGELRPNLKSSIQTTNPCPNHA